MAFEAFVGSTLFFLILFIILFSVIAFIAALVEILRSKNDSGWKLLWAAVCFFFGILGVILYLFIGRKNLQGDKIGIGKILLVAAILLVFLLVILFFIVLFLYSTG